MAVTARLGRLNVRLAAATGTRNEATGTRDAANREIAALIRSIELNNEANERDERERKSIPAKIVAIRAKKEEIKTKWTDGIVNALNNIQFTVSANLVPEMISNDGKIYIKM